MHKEFRGGGGLRGSWGWGLRSNFGAPLLYVCALFWGSHIWGFRTQALPLSPGYFVASSQVEVLLPVVLHRKERLESTPDSTLTSESTLGSTFGDFPVLAPQGPSRSTDT